MCKLPNSVSESVGVEGKKPLKHSAALRIVVGKRRRSHPHTFGYQFLNAPNYYLKCWTFFKICYNYPPMREFEQDIMFTKGFPAEFQYDREIPPSGLIYDVQSWDPRFLSQAAGEVALVVTLIASSCQVTTRLITEQPPPTAAVRWEYDKLTVADCESDGLTRGSSGYGFDIGNGFAFVFSLDLRERLLTATSNDPSDPFEVTVPFSEAFRFKKGPNESIMVINCGGHIATQYEKSGE